MCLSHILHSICRKPIHIVGGGDYGFESQLFSSDDDDDDNDDDDNGDSSDGGDGQQSSSLTLKKLKIKRSQETWLP